MKKFAFTLAEVLITLGIIGTVAAMTLPSLITRNQNKALEAGLKKNYSVIQQALDMYQAENGERLKPEDTGLSKSSNDLSNLLLPYFQVLTDCGYSYISKCMPLPDGEEAGDTKKVSYIYKTYNNNTLNLTLLDDEQFVLLDGSLILIENTGNKTAKKNRFISVDVNGIEKRPNKWGHDLFTFQLMNDGRILPMGADGTEYEDENTYCSINSSHVYNGIGCTYRALTEKDYFNNLPR